MNESELAQWLYDELKKNGGSGVMGEFKDLGGTQRQMAWLLTARRLLNSRFFTKYKEMAKNGNALVAELKPESTTNLNEVKPVYYLHDIKIREMGLEQFHPIAQWLNKCPIKFEHHRLPIYSESHFLKDGDLE